MKQTRTTNKEDIKAFKKLLMIDTNVISKWESITYVTSWHMDS